MYMNAVFITPSNFKKCNYFCKQKICSLEMLVDLLSVNYVVKNKFTFTKVPKS